jgi:DNA-directed RNA polymerase alpha subunit
MNSLYPKIYHFDEKGTHKINKLNTIFSQNLTNSKFDSPWVSYLQVPALKLLKINKNDDSSLEELKFSDNQKKRKIFLAITNLVKKHRKKYPAINLRKKLNLRSDSFRDNMNSISEKNNKANYINKFSNFFNSTPLTIDSIFNPVTKVNYIIEVNDFKISQAGFETSHETLELLELLNVSKTETRFVDFADKTIQGDYFVSSNNLTITPNMSFTKNSNFLENILEIKREINFLKKETPKHNIIFEIWTNGSMHPRDAIYQGFKNLVRIFSKLNKINAFMINPLTLSSLEKNVSFVLPGEQSKGNKKIDKEIKKNYFLKKLKQNEISDTITDPLILSRELPNLSPLNDISFISTYMAPKLKNFYFSTEANNFKWSHISKDSGIQVHSQSRLLNKIDSSCPPIGMGMDMDMDMDGIKYENLNTNKNNIKNLNDQNLEILNLSLRSYTSLKRLNINSIEELKKFLISYNKSSDFKKLSKICFEEIEQSLQKLECNK